jgi:predicted dinucleotide-utilizing enzyme
MVTKEKLMAKSGFKAAVSLVKTLNREIKKVEREASKNQRQREMQARKEAREQERYARKIASEFERQTNLASKLAVANKKEQIKVETSEAKEAYEYRCEERKFLREQIVNEELK